MLTKREFDLLVLLENEQNNKTQRELSKELNCSVGTVNNILKEIIELGYYDGHNVTTLGYQVLEPYRVKRAIFLAAGFGSRLMPITINTPKPLIRVNGKRIIEGLIDSVLKVGIKEIFIVRGHLKEQFNELLIKYPNIKFIDNPLYNECNNITSAFYAKDLFKNAYVFDADLIIQNPKIIKKYAYDSFMYGIKVSRSDDWCLNTNKKGVINSLELGGIDAYREVGISYWNETDGINLEKDIEEVLYLPGGKERFWELVPLKYKKANYQVSIKECGANDVIEIDTFNELKKIDRSYC